MIEIMRTRKQRSIAWVRCSAFLIDRLLGQFEEVVVCYSRLVTSLFLTRLRAAKRPLKPGSLMRVRSTMVPA
jgi:hypothetical protein